MNNKVNPQSSAKEADKGGYPRVRREITTTPIEIRQAKGWYHCHQSPVAHRGPGYS